MPSAPFMPFLRPLPLPRLASVRALQRRISSQPCLRQQATVTAAKPLASPPPPSTAAIERSAQPLPANALPPLPYHVHRTASQKLPIYHLAKRGGNLHQTRIRKIEGDVEKLRDEIIKVIGMKQEHVVINRLTGHIIIKGWYREDIKKFLQDRHF